MSKRASKSEIQNRVNYAANLAAEGQSFSLITSQVAEKYSISRRQARRITASAYNLLKDDIQEGDLNRPEMTAKLLNTLESAMYLALKKGNYSAVAANGKVLMRLIGLDTHDVNHNHRFKHGRSTAYYG
tara:strand:- start:779 stop:1165 length:387 start_codon:yes stop_codon:yes gene_type:complete